MKFRQGDIVVVKDWGKTYINTSVRFVFNYDSTPALTNYTKETSHKRSQVINGKKTWNLDNKTEWIIIRRANKNKDIFLLVNHDTLKFIEIGHEGIRSISHSKEESYNIY